MLKRPFDVEVLEDGDDASSSGGRQPKRGNSLSSLLGGNEGFVQSLPYHPIQVFRTKEAYNAWWKENKKGWKYRNSYKRKKTDGEAKVYICSKRTNPCPHKVQAVFEDGQVLVRTTLLVEHEELHSKKPVSWRLETPSFHQTNTIVQDGQTSIPTSGMSEGPSANNQPPVEVDETMELEQPTTTGQHQGICSDRTMEIEQMQPRDEVHQADGLRISVPKEFKVKMCKTTVATELPYYKYEEDREMIYKNFSAPKGLVLMISNEKFNKLKSKRDGTKEDEKNLTSLFKQLGYETRILENRTAKQMMEDAREFANDIGHMNAQSCIVVVLSHGDYDELAGKDCLPLDKEARMEKDYDPTKYGRVNAHDFLRCFNSENAENLARKPKLFFFQACRGGYKDQYVAIDDIDDPWTKTSTHGNQPYVPKFSKTSKHGNQAYAPAFGSNKTAIEADFIVCHSSTANHVSYRSPLGGSWFVRVICEVFSEFAAKEDLNSLLIRVNKRIAERDRKITDKFGMKYDVKQVPEFSSRLTKKFYFFPGITSEGNAPLTAPARSALSASPERSAIQSSSGHLLKTLASTSTNVRVNEGAAKRFVQQIISAGADLNEKVLVELAMHQSNAQMLDVILEKAGVDFMGSDGRTLLHIAAGSGYLDAATALIEKKPRLINTTSKIGCTPLHCACENGHFKVAKLLLEKGARIDAVDKSGRTPLHYACSIGELTIAKWLLGNGARIDAVDNDGQSLLHYACGNGYLNIAILLLGNGAKIDGVDNNGQSLLHYACGNGYLNIAKWLLKNDAKIDAVDNDGRSLLHYACSDGELETAKWLLEEGADIHAVDYDGRSLLHYACQNGELEIARWLRDNSAKITVGDSAGNIPWDLAFESGFGDEFSEFDFRSRNPSRTN